MDSDLSFWDNIFLMTLSIFLFVIKLPVNRSDKIYLFCIVCFYAALFMALFYIVGFDYKIIALGRFVRF